ncbi:glycosyltransferase [Chitinilyticum piscinae]|uniref:glycosyltransferase n=1 Tax=Chitinilyticum piscinae TaxID=2866724 RepID=UPI00187DECE4|nr:glycosyltransferase [Chitinilyticum piscinae]
MKVAIFLRDLGLGGVERCAVLVGEGLVARGFDVTLVLLGGHRNLWEARIRQVKVVDLSAQWQPLKPWTWLKGWRAARRIAREHDVVIAGTFLLPLYMAFAATRGLGKRVLGWVHGPMAELDAFARMNPVHRFACRYVYRRLDELIFVSQHARESLSRWLGEAPRPGWQVLPNFIDDADPAGSPPLPREPSALLRMVFVGRIAEEKQPGLWLDALAELNARALPAQLTVVGDGPLEGWLRDEAQRRGLAEQLVLAGRQEEVAPYLQAADVLLLTSSFEGCPLVVLEAMAQGLPVVSTNAGGVYELFGERRGEFVVDEASGAALAGLLQRQDRAALSWWLLERAVRYSAKTTLEKWQKLLD